VSLSQASAFVAARVAAGEWADLSKLDAAVSNEIPAAFIRRLLLGHPLSKSELDEVRRQQPDYAKFLSADDQAPVPVRLAGVRVRNAKISGSLNLTGCYGADGAGLPGLALEECILEGDRDVPCPPDLDHPDHLLSLDLSRSRIARLSLHYSRFGFIRARESVIDGSVDISGVGPVSGWSDRPWPGIEPGIDKSEFLAAPSDKGRAAETVQKFVGEYDCCWVDLTASRIGGDVVALDAKLRTPRARKQDSYHFMDTRYGLALTRATVGGSLIAYRESVFDGGLNLHLVEMRGEVWLGGATLIKRESGSSLDAHCATLGGLYAAAEQPLRTFGGIHLSAAMIHGHLCLRGAELDGDGASAFHAESMVVDGDILLDSEMNLESGPSTIFKARGPVRLVGSTTVGGFLNVAGAIIDGNSAKPENYDKDDAFDASSICLGGDARLAGLVTRGSVWLKSSNIGGKLDLKGAELYGDGAEAMDGSFMCVAGDLILDDNKMEGAIRLTHASAGVLNDALGGYGDPKKTRIELDGFRYDSLHECDLTKDGDKLGCTASRIAWLERMPEYKPQPYMQLARTLAGQGRVVEAREILFAKRNKDLGERRNMIERHGVFKRVTERVICISLCLFSKLFGYGLKPSRAIWTILFAWALGSLLVAGANYRGAMIIDQQPIAGSVRGGNQIGAVEAKDAVVDNVPCKDAINPVWYALDVFIPLVDLRQETKCEIGAARVERGAESQLLTGEVGIYRMLKTFYALAGWIIISLAILTFSGVLQRRLE
jgi:hypothetical protein